MTKKAKPPITFPPDRPIGNALIFHHEESLQKAVSERVKDEIRRLAILGCYYEIEADDLSHFTYQLALTMARELYPEPKQSGQKKKWGATQIGCLVVEMERLIKPRSRTYGISYVADILAKREPWKSFLKGDGGVEMLRTTYTKYRADKWAEVMRKAHQHHVETNTLNEWEQDVFQYVNHSSDK